MAENWKKIKDSDVIHIWGNTCDEPTCENEIAIPPTFYEENGTPMCACGEDMTYLRTEIRNLKKGKK